jgi:trimeric autotransporter adhesin
MVNQAFSFTDINLSYLTFCDQRDCYYGLPKPLKYVSLKLTPIRMKTLLFSMLILACTIAQAQNTNLGTGAGNAGSLNTSIGYFAGDVVTGYQNSFVGAYSGLSTNNGWENSFFGYKSGYYNSAGAQNTFSGSYSGELNTTGSKNSFSGALAGKQNTTASNNSFFGFASGYTNSIGIKNAFFGSESGFYNTTGSYNSFFGNESGNKNSTGDLNSFFGSGAGFSNTTGSSNTLVGFNSGYTNTTGSANTFVGIESGFSNSSGSINTFIGNRAGRNNTVGTNNTFVGNLAGGANNKESGNTFVGASAGGNTIGAYNTFLGTASGQLSISGNYNVFVGSQAGISNTAGSKNVFIGQSSGSSNTGSDNVFIGNEAGAFTVGSNLFIVNNAGTSTPLLYGNFSTKQLGIGTTSLGTYALSVNGDAFASGLWLSSDKRFKQNEKTLTGALEKLNNVKGVSYQFKKGEATNGKAFSDGTQLGFIAQDLQKTFPELVKENSDGYLAVNYSGMIPVLVEAIKELKAEINQLKSQLNSTGSVEKNLDIHATQSGALLEQNHPNPFNEETLIGYTLPDGTTSSALYIFDLTGKQIAVFENLKHGKNELSISASKLSPGLYNYSLIVNGRIVDTKKMLLTN